MPRIADALDRESRSVDLEQGDFERLLDRRERKQRNRRIRAGAVAVIVALATAAAPRPLDRLGARPGDPAEAARGWRGPPRGEAWGPGTPTAERRARSSTPGRSRLPPRTSPAPHGPPTVSGSRSVEARDPRRRTLGRRHRRRRSATGRHGRGLVSVGSGRPPRTNSSSCLAAM